jgi:hypothetical protein
VIAEDQLDGLDAWREKLEATSAARRWSSCAVGVERWLEACDSYIRAEEAVLSAAEGYAAQKREIEGRFSARRAQLTALESRGAAHDARTDELARAVELALAARPFALDLADAALKAFETAVVSLARR